MRQMRDTADFGYLELVTDRLREVESTQASAIARAARLMADAVEQDRLIHIYAGGGHTTLVMGEMFFRAGGLCNVNPLMETGLSVFNQALKYLELERCVNYGGAIVKYYNLQPGDVLLIFHNVGVNPATIDAAMEASRAGAKIVAISSGFWQALPGDSPIRHPSGANLFDFAEVCIDDLNPVGDAEIRLEEGMPPMAPTSNLVDFYIAHRLELATAAECLRRGVSAPVWRSANAENGDEYNRKYLDHYFNRVKCL